MAGLFGRHLRGRKCFHFLKYFCRRNRRIDQASYLTEVERRLQGLEKLVAQRLPDLNIDEALASDVVKAPRGELVPSSLSIASSTPQGAASVSSREAEGDGEVISDAVPDAADGFDWQEVANELADGMAALSVEPTGTGYLGQCLVCSALITTDQASRFYRGSIFPSRPAVLGRKEPTHTSA